MNCPPSSRLAENFDDTTSEAAEEGTLAHELADLDLQRYLNLISVDEHSDKVKTLKEDPLFKSEMLTHVEVYTDFCIETYVELLPEDIDAEMFVELKVDISKYVPESFGTCDNIIVSRGVLILSDLKYGIGLPVTAIGNPQLRLYALGALAAFGESHGIHTVVMNIVQPRLEAISTETMSVEDLVFWAEEEVEKAAEIAYEGGGEAKAGYWCTFCRVRPRCKKLTAHVLEASQSAFIDSPYLMDDEEVMAAYAAISDFKKWASSIKDYIVAEALKGKQWTGVKVVRGTGRSKWVDPKKVISQLHDMGFADEQITNVKPKSISDVKKLMSVDKFKETVGKLVIKPQGGPTITDINDKRPPWGLSQAQADFSE